MLEERLMFNADNPTIRACPACGKKSYVMYEICPSCQNANGEKFKTVFRCGECQYEERSEEPTVVWLGKMEVEFGMQTKTSLGIVMENSVAEKATHFVNSFSGREVSHFVKL